MVGNLGHGALQVVGSSLKIEWSAAALADLDRFAAFLHEHHPELAGRVAREIVARSSLLTEHPRLGRVLAGGNYRELVLRVLNGRYVFQYRIDRERIVMLRVFHARERRG